MLCRNVDGAPFSSDKRRLPFRHELSWIGRVTFPYPPTSAPQGAKNVSHRALFSAFFKIGILGFGGVAGWVRQILVEERHYLDDREFAGLSGIASVLPGANTVNLAVMLGDRHHGFSGALTALAGLLLAPILILIIIASLYDRYATISEIENAVAGAAAATAGLVIANAYKMGRGSGADALSVLIAGVTFFTIGVLQVPLTATLAVMVPASLVARAMTRSRS